MPGTPFKFKPLYLRSGAKLQSLKDHLLRRFEVAWVRGEISKTNPVCSHKVVSVPATCRHCKVSTYGLRLRYSVFKNNTTLKSHSECFSPENCPSGSKGMRQTCKLQKKVRTVPTSVRVCSTRTSSCLNKEK